MTTESKGREAVAFVAPLGVFLGLLAVLPLIKIDNSALPWYRSAPEHWFYPLQCIACLGVLLYFWKHYTFRPISGTALAVVLGIATILVWVAPSILAGAVLPDVGEDDSPWKWFGLIPRKEGFDPWLFEGNTLALWATVGMRFFRMVVIVPLVEEVFWRGFLMRWLVDTDRPFWKTPFGSSTPLAVWGTTGLFMLAHQPADYVGALVFGLAMAWLAIRTKSLWACILMHAVANLALGIYVMLTGSWGFW